MVTGHPPLHVVATALAQLAASLAAPVQPPAHRHLHGGSHEEGTSETTESTRSMSRSMHGRAGGARRRLLVFPELVQTVAGPGAGQPTQALRLLVVLTAAPRVPQGGTPGVRSGSNGGPGRQRGRGTAAEAAMAGNRAAASGSAMAGEGKPGEGPPGVQERARRRGASTGRSRDSDRGTAPPP